ncbi:large ribosomal subunit protein mL53 [Atheta coriaria]|uniref:large ribosomal subunit protein mL53 n=1 Tax=Dalotia coriaria TaxID=877792 RepID=UPI0031F3DA66
MSIYYSGTYKRSAGIISAIAKQMKSINLKPVKKIQVSFDPFHANAVTARDFLYFINAPRIINTNLNCVIKPNVVCDRSEPEIKIHLTDSSLVTFKANNLNVLEIFQAFNKHISSQVKQEEVSTSSQTAKLEKKKLKKR